MNPTVTFPCASPGVMLVEGRCHQGGTGLSGRPRWGAVAPALSLHPPPDTPALRENTAICFLRNSSHFLRESQQHHKPPQSASGAWTIAQEPGGGGSRPVPLSPLVQGPNLAIPARRGPTLRTAAASNKPARQHTGVREMISQRRLGNKYPRRTEDAQLANCANGRLLASAQRSEAVLAPGS